MPQIDISQDIDTIEHPDDLRRLARSLETVVRYCDKRAAAKHGERFGALKGAIAEALDAAREIKTHELPADGIVRW